MSLGKNYKKKKVENLEEEFLKCLEKQEKISSLLNEKCEYNNELINNTKENLEEKFLSCLEEQEKILSLFDEECEYNEELINNNTKENITNDNEIVIYKLLISQHSVGMRIEDYCNSCYMFTNKELALKFAYEKAVNFSECYKREELEYNIKGEYVWKSDSNYGVDDYLIEIIESKLNFNNDIIEEIHFNGIA